MVSKKPAKCAPEKNEKKKRKKFFFFYTKQESLYFKSLLEKNQIFFEQGNDQTKKGDIYLFGIRKTDLNKVSKINYETLGKFRKPIFANKKLQFFILGLGLFILLITLISYIVSQ